MQVETITRVQLSDITEIHITCTRCNRSFDMPPSLMVGENVPLDCPFCEKPFAQNNHPSGLQEIGKVFDRLNRQNSPLTVEFIVPHRP